MNDGDRIVQLSNLLMKKEISAESVTRGIKEGILNSDAIRRSDALPDLIFTVAKHVKDEDIFDELKDILDAVFTHDPMLLFVARLDANKDTPLSCAVRHSSVVMTQYLLERFAEMQDRKENAFQNFFAPQSIQSVNPDETSIYDLAQKIESKKKGKSPKHQKQMLEMLYSYGAILFAQAAKNKDTFDDFMNKEHQLLYPRAKTLSPFTQSTVFNSIVNAESSSSSQAILILDTTYWKALLSEIKNTSLIVATENEELTKLIKAWLKAQDEKIDEMNASSQWQMNNLLRSFVTGVTHIDEERHVRNAMIYSVIPAAALYGLVKLFEYTLSVGQQRQDALDKLYDLYPCDDFESCAYATSYLTCDISNSTLFGPPFEKDYEHCYSLFSKLFGMGFALAFCLFGVIVLLVLEGSAKIMEAATKPVYFAIKSPFRTIVEYLGPYSPEKNIANKDALVVILRDLLKVFKAAMSDTQTSRIDDINVRDKEINLQDLADTIMRLELFIKQYEMLTSKSDLKFKPQTLRAIRTVSADTDIEIGLSRRPGLGSTAVKWMGSAKGARIIVTEKSALIGSHQGSINNIQEDIEDQSASTKRCGGCF